jgi:uncharacterized protein (TIGR02266 family)
MLDRVAPLPPPLPRESPGTIEHRRCPRVPLEVQVGLDTHTNFYTGFGENVSSGGLFVATFALLPLGTSIELTFSLPDGAQLRVQSVVRWLRDPHDLELRDTPPGMGLEFVELDPEARACVEAYVAARDPMFFPD